MLSSSLHCLCRASLAYFLFASAGIVAALYSDSDAVLELNTSNFEKHVLQSDGVAMVHFGATWSPQDKALAPKLVAAANHLKGMALVGFLDCSDQDKAGNLCQRFGVTGFPTLKVFGSDKVKNPYTGELSKEPTDYNGPASSKALVDALTSQLSDLHITRLAARGDLEALRERAAGRPMVLLFTDKQAPSALYKALSTQLRRGLVFGLVHFSAAELAEQFGVTTFPTLLVIKADGSGHETHTGELRAPALMAFLRGFSAEGDPAAADEAAGREAAGGKGTAAWAFVKQLEGLSEVAAADGREDMALVALHGTGEEGCKGAREAFLTAAGDMQAVVDTLLVAVLAADVAAGSEGAALLGRLGVDARALEREPCELQVVLLPFGADKPALEDYRTYSGPPDGRALQRWVTDQVPPHLVPPQVDDMSGPAYLTADPSEGAMSLAPKVLLFTNKDEAPGVFKALAMALRGRGNLAFGWVQANNPSARQTVESFKPPRVPSLTVVMASPAPGDDEESGRVRFGMQPYFGPLKFGPMREFLEEVARQVEMSSGVVNDPELIAMMLPKITNQSEFETHCTAKAGMCLLGLLDSADPGFGAEFKELLVMALQQSRGGSSSPLHFAWLEGRRHKAVMQTFGLVSSDLPALVALSAKRMRFAVMPTVEEDGGSRGPRLSPEAVGRFVNDVLSAKIRTQPLQALPEISAGGGADGGSGAGDTAAGAGGAAGAPEEAVMAAVEEEEFDLSDIMAEEVEGGAVAGGKADRLKEIEEQLKAEEEARKAAESAAKSSSGKKKKSSKKKKGKKGGSKGKAASPEEL